MLTVSNSKHHNMDTLPLDSEDATKPVFQPRGLSEELQLLLSDESDFSNTTRYIGGLIDQVLARFVMTPEQRGEIRVALIMDIPVAAHRYLRTKRDISGAYPFSTYFTWYISERVNGANLLKKKD